MENQNNHNNQSGVTMDGLARMVQKGFSGVDQRLDKIDSHLDKVDGRLDKIEDRLGTIEKLLIKDHRMRIEKLETDIKELKELLAVS